MSSILDQRLVVDIGWFGLESRPPEGYVSEIGLCLLDTVRLKRIEKHTIHVKSVKSEGGDHSTPLTASAEGDLVTAVTFREAMTILKEKYHSKDRLWASWNSRNRSRLEMACKDQNVEFPFGRNHLDIKTLSIAVLGIDRNFGMEETCRELGISGKKKPIRCVDAAWNIAGILCRILKGRR